MGDKWYRGEAVGVAPIPADKTADHDIGDGMYLTDTKEVALKYADLRADDPAARRVYSVVIDPSSLRVLDLTTDARWQKDLKMVEPSIKLANVNYGRVFKNFVTANRINLDEYDAVIGLDYVRGGRQICILYRGGRPMDLPNVVRGNFRPEPIGTELPLDSDSIVRRMPNGSSGFGEGLTIVGFGIAELALSFLAAKLQESVTRSWLDRQTKELQPEIWRQIQDHNAAVANLQSQGKKAYANIIIEIQSSVTRASEIGPVQDVPIVKLKQVEISSEDLSIDRGVTERKEYGVMAWEYRQYIYSVQVALSPAEVNLFKALMLEYQFIDQQTNLYPSDTNLKLSRTKVIQAITSAFGKDAEVDVLNPWMWP